jgi:hypothetical protein
MRSFGPEGKRPPPVIVLSAHGEKEKAAETKIEVKE